MSDSGTDVKSTGQGVRLGFIELAPDISKGNAYAFFYAAFAVIGLLTFISTGTAQVLNAIGVPQNEHGTVSSNLVIVTEIVQILLFSAVGVIQIASFTFAHGQWFFVIICYTREKVIFMFFENVTTHNTP